MANDEELTPLESLKQLQDSVGHIETVSTESIINRHRQFLDEYLRLLSDQIAQRGQELGIKLMCVRGTSQIALSFPTIFKREHRFMFYFILRYLTRKMDEDIAEFEKPVFCLRRDFYEACIPEEWRTMIKFNNFGRAITNFVRYDVKSSLRRRSGGVDPSSNRNKLKNLGAAYKLQSLWEIFYAVKIAMAILYPRLVHMNSTTDPEQRKAPPRLYSVDQFENGETGDLDWLMRAELDEVTEALTVPEERDLDAFLED